MKRPFLIALFLFVCAGALYAETILEQAQKLATDKKPQEAIRLLKDYDKEHPNDVDVHELIQKIMVRNDGKQEALSEYKGRYESEPSGLNGYLYARLLDLPSQREKVFEEAIAKDPQSVWGYFGLANAFMDEDRLQEGVDLANESLAKAKEPAKLHYVMARMYRRMQDYDNAVLHMREFYRLDPTDDHLEDVRAYEWLQVEHADSTEKKFELARTWLKTYRDKAMKPDGIEEDITLAEIAFLFARDGKDVATVKELVTAAIADVQKQEIPPAGDDRRLYLRMKGALFALQGWTDARHKKPNEALKNLKLAAETGPGSETYYFSAQAYLLLGKKSDALKNALEAASYPPVYEGSSELARQLWKQLHRSTEGLEEALHKQREAFAPQRKELALSQMVSEKFEPFEMTDPDGKKVTDKDISGKIVLMNFWAVWCPPCREELPHWNKFYADHKNDPDLVFAAVGDEPWETLLNYSKHHDFSFPLFRNERYLKEFSVDGIPTLVLIDPHGTIRFRNAGFEEGMEYEETLLWQIDAVRGLASQPAKQ